MSIDADVSQIRTDSYYNNTIQKIEHTLNSFSYVTLFKCVFRAIYIRFWVRVVKQNFTLIFFGESYYEAVKMLI